MALSYNLKIFENVKILFEGCNGLEVFQFVQQNIGKIKISFIMLDLEMPIMNGFEACQKICRLYDEEKKLF
jgi:CheY-like chemotaxis protein